MKKVQATKWLGATFKCPVCKEEMFLAAANKKTLEIRRIFALSKKSNCEVGKIIFHCKREEEEDAILKTS